MLAWSNQKLKKRKLKRQISKNVSVRFKFKDKKLYNF